jgi:protein-tyrosine phosphatase
VIDIHAHLLPQVDDGPSDWEEVLVMIEAGIRDGVQGVVCTSHVLNRLDEEFEAKLLFKFDQLKRMVQDRRIPISLWLGSELHVNAQVDLRSPVATFANNRKYLLLELPLNDIPKDVDQRLFHLHLQGMRPILAHPERNAALVMKPELVYGMVQRGILMQVNAGSLLGVFGGKIRKMAHQMIEHNLVHFVASDCHSAEQRPMSLGKAYRAVEAEFGKDVAVALFAANPKTAVQGGDLWTPEPVPFDKKKRRLWL